MNRSTNKTSEFGLLACGRSGNWSIDVDEALNGDEAYHLQIDGPSIYVRFELAALSVVGMILDVFDGGLAELRLGQFAGGPVTLVRDNEGNRWFLIVAPEPQSCVRIELSTADAAALRDALKQVQRDLSDTATPARPAERVQTHLA